MITKGFNDLNDVLTFALNQDLGPLGDVTSLATISPSQQATAEYVVKAKSGIVSGLNVTEQIFKLLDPHVTFTPFFSNGDKTKSGDLIAKLSGPAQSILVGERVSLEFLRRMSGIATKTAKFVHKVKGTGTTILDTRKILPAFGKLDKQAVKDGGGQNHRLNLSQMGLLKNNHLDLLKGNITKATNLFRAKYPTIPLEIEVRNESELREALKNHPNRILLDNMSLAETKQSVAIRNEYCSTSKINVPLEASGNMTLTKVQKVAATGVEYISVGALTHSVPAFDISLHITFNK